MFKKYLLVIIALFTFVNNVNASTAILLSENDMVVGSRLIVRGTVLGSEVRQDNPNLIPFTYTRLGVEEYLKGSLNSREIVIKEPGGRIGGVGAVIHGIPEFTAGEEVVLFLDTWPDGSLRVYQWFMGKYLLSLENGVVRISRSIGGNSVTVLNPDLLVTAKEDFISFAERIKRTTKLLDTQSKTYLNRYYKNAILVRPPELKDNVSNFTFLNPYTPLIFFQPFVGQNVVFRVNPVGAPSGFLPNGINASLAAWSSVSGSGLRLTNGGNTSGCGLLSLDGENTISFNNCDNYPPFSPSPTGCAGILAAAGIIQYDPFQNRVVNGITFYKAVEANMSFNPYASCYFNNVCNVQEIATHELGHTIGLGHSLDSTATMYAYAHFDGRCAGLRQDDMDGVRFMYPSTGVPTPTPTPTPVPTPTPRPTPVPTPTPIPPVGQLAKRADFDGDGKADYAVWDNVTCNWTIKQSSDGQLKTYFWGRSYSPFFDKATPQDYDGDGKIDVSVWRGSTGVWYTINSSNSLTSAITFGTPADKPMPAQWDGDKKADLALWNQSTGVWKIRQSTTGTVKTFMFGNFYDTALVGDIDGDRKADPVLFRDGSWYFITSSDDQLRSETHGMSGDIPLLADFDGDGKDDLTVFRSNFWYVLKSSDKVVQTAFWGRPEAPFYDILQPADFSGDGKADFAVWRSSNFNWYVLNPTTNVQTIFNLGNSNSVPTVYIK